MNMRSRNGPILVAAASARRSAGLIGRVAALSLAWIALGTAGCNQILWRADLSGALRQARSDGRLVLVYYWSPFNRDCQKMDNGVFRSGDVIQTMAGTIPVRLWSDFCASWARQVGVSKVPSFVIYRSDGQIVRLREGTMDEGRFRGFVVSGKLSE